MKDFLASRRSTKLKFITDPAPTGEELQNILQTAVRVPDHGKLCPFYFILFEGNARSEFGKHLRNTWAKDHLDATSEQLDHEEQRFMRAPLVIAVISRIRDAKIPAWEQILSAGACCYNLCLTCNAHGYGTNWLTEWYTYHPDIRAALNLEDGRDNVAGFIYVGTETEKQLPGIINHYGDDLSHKGDIYNKDGLGKPERGFEV